MALVAHIFLLMETKQLAPQEQVSAKEEEEKEEDVVDDISHEQDLLGHVRVLRSGDRLDDGPVAPVFLVSLEGLTTA
ncbi:hypothetical protein FIBSPDRAFT_945572 [Athelia psychrophila]|uniref:Uncharacterized protein n=1 Tax=Athelia psychrophila TaxID=1759441 RepID=A0A167T3U5_9AGAM|nr:hypothetical protein FIBSPDRAFT_969876 [Fibularhizoctonia sp. CBS 109695]KZP31089.1 hypothetical protein FIBSPDRAFT_945572 [Fibularhizoctonia sp. CBS 109695]